jgi:uncharacterized damage-inducible protein DinB
MKEFLMDMFHTNLEANLKMIGAVSKMPSPEEGMRHLSHLANCQYKWLDRIKLFPDESKLDWWEPVYLADQLEKAFIESTELWISYLSSTSEGEIESLKYYKGYDGKNWEAQLKDIALQLIFHSFHHRAQIQMMIRQQGLKPAFIDYIGYRSKKSGITDAS